MKKMVYEEYDIEDLKRILSHLRPDTNRIILTEHFLEKICHRRIHEVTVTDTLDNIKPVRQ